MGRAKDANGNLAAIGDHQLAKRGHRTTPTGMWNVECGMRNAESKSSDSDTTNDFSIPNPAFRISSGFRLDRILEHSDRYDRRANQVAGLEERPGCRADARWGSGGNDVSGLERDELRQERDD